MLKTLTQNPSGGRAVYSVVMETPNVALPGCVGNVCQPDCVPAMQLPWQLVKSFMCTTT